MSTYARKANKNLDLTGKTAAVIGGTQGIGAAVAVRFAQAGASVLVVGRNEVLGQKVVEEMKRVGKEGARYEFVKADLSLIAEIKRVAVALQDLAGPQGINYLVQSQGTTPNGTLKLTAESHDAHFITNVLSRLGLAYLLAKSGTLKDAWLSVGGPRGNRGVAPDAEDLELQGLERSKWQKSMQEEMVRDLDTMDAVVLTFSATFPEMKSYHVYPGLVTTQGLANSDFPRLATIIWLLGPLLALTIGNTPASYADIPVYLLCNLDNQEKGLAFSNQKLQSVGEPRWAKDEPAKARKVWDRLVEIGGF
ncbi:protein of glucose/ribitol dehydrogenase family [Pseudohyphozyma bogoriensis]|nr:protein of glucose/ribitol dehydrogenase family [Pseudohyphozyma bogoriensis]